MHHRNFGCQTKSLNKHKHRIKLFLLDPWRILFTCTFQNFFTKILNMCYKFLAIISCAAISCLNLVMNSSARSSIPCIWGDANASDSHIPSEPQDLPPLFLVPSSPETLLVRGFCAVGGFNFNCPTNSHEGSLKSLSMYTGAGFLWNPKIKFLTVTNLLWRKKRLPTMNFGGALEVASLVIGFEGFLGFFMDLDLDLLSLPIVEVKLFHAFLAGGSLNLSFRLMQDFMTEEERAMLQIRENSIKFRLKVCSFIR